MRKITQAQHRKLHALARELGMDNDLLHEYIFMLTEKGSLKDLSVGEAGRVIDGMEGRKKYEKGDRVSCRQEHFIFILMGKLKWVTDKGEPDIRRLNGFVKKQYGIEDYRQMTRGTACKVIEAFKTLQEREGKAGRG